MSRDPGRRAVVTGLGAITPIGNDPGTFWTSLTAGVSGVARIASYDPSKEEVQIAAEVKGFDPRTWIDFKAGPPHEPLQPARRRRRGTGHRACRPSDH